MKILFLFSAAFLWHSNALAQINYADSTVQTVSYWNKNDSQHYKINYDKYAVKQEDTLGRTLASYEVDLTVVDSTENAYTLEWKYSNLKVVQEGDLATVAAFGLMNNIKVLYKVDETGSFIEVLNWEEIRDYFQAETKKQLASPKINSVSKSILEQVAKSFSTKEAIESSAIKDIQQLHFFHGVKYTLGEKVEGQLKVANMLGGEPFDAHFEMELISINPEEDSYVTKLSQTVDPAQLQTATYEFLKELSKKDPSLMPDKELLKDLSHEMVTASGIHDSGWVLYSYQTNSVNILERTNYEIREIEIILPEEK